MGRTRASIFDGALSSLFRDPVARVLEEVRIVGDMEQTVSMLSESTKLDYKTVKSALQRLKKFGYVSETRKIGNAQAYRFNVETELRALLDCIAKLQNGKRTRR